MDGHTAIEPASLVDADRHFLTALAEVGDNRRMSVVQPIYSATGIKLLDAGATVNSRTLERLVGHRLAAPIESSVAAEGSLKPAEIVADARKEIDSARLLAHLAGGCRNVERIWSHVAAAPLPASVLFRLTVARERFPDLYRHSLRAAFVALRIGDEAQVAPREQELLATAALMHDFGMLHVDPARFDQGRPLDTATRRQLRAHPLTGMLIAVREPQLNPAIATAIVQHHERLDGTGYPSSLAAAEITRLARVLMLVELVLAMVEQPVATAELQLSLILRANHRGFDRELAAAVLAALPRLEVADEAGAGDSGSGTHLAGLFAQAGAIRAGTSSGAAGDARRFVSERLQRVRRLLAEVGLEPESDAAPETFAGDATALAELAGLRSEALWQLQQIAFDAILRWPHLVDPASGDPADPALREWLLAATEDGARASG